MWSEWCMAMCRCIDAGMMGYIVRCVSDDLVGHVAIVSSMLSYLVGRCNASLASIGNDLKVGIWAKLELKT